MIGNMSFNMDSIKNKTDDTVLKMSYKKTDSNKAKSVSSDKDFSTVLKSETKKEDKKIDNMSNASDKVSKDDKSKSLSELKDEIEDLKDEAEKSKNTDLAELLNQILNILNKLMQNNTSENSENIKESFSKLVESILNVSDNSDKLNELMNLFKSDDSLISLKDLTSEMKEISSMISENKNDNIKDKISDLLSKLTDNNSSKKDTVINLNNNEQALVNDDSKDQSFQSQSDMSKSNDKSSSADSDSDSKVLKGILDDNKSDSIFSKINQAAQKTQNVQTVVKTDGNIVNKVTIVDDIIKDVKFMSTTDLKELTVKINPKELGEITIKLIAQDNGAMKAEIKANTKDAYTLLNQNLFDIKDKLNGENIKINDVNVSLYQEDTTFYKNGQFNSMFSHNGNQEADEKNYSYSESNISGNDNQEGDDTRNFAKEDSSINYFA
ncbi:flagellar hook-length control protein FliK [Clostridium sp. BJN0001]|uniref:flagellar hook-length control protein FliK n=1 Tax=Clostridium sp. BJN0001 TaxID=2930219 RepID=UPI001FD42C5A|nr:flagellar hook-length control protein FliK [Clostridium sp. BJN0001]